MKGAPGTLHFTAGARESETESVGGEGKAGGGSGQERAEAELLTSKQYVKESGGNW